MGGGLVFEKLEPYYANKVLVLATYRQIQKDFDDIEFTIDEKTLLLNPYAYLLQELTPLIDALMCKNHTRLMQFLYRVDIPENKLNEIIAQNNDWSMDKAMAHLIIYRELQKVVTRHLYSQQ